jgi:hypothetical protein
MRLFKKSAYRLASSSYPRRRISVESITGYQVICVAQLLYIDRRIIPLIGLFPRAVPDQQRKQGQQKVQG